MTTENTQLYSEELSVDAEGYPSAAALEERLLKIEERLSGYHLMDQMRDEAEQTFRRRRLESKLGFGRAIGAFVECLMEEGMLSEDFRIGNNPFDVSELKPLINDALTAVEEAHEQAVSARDSADEAQGYANQANEEADNAQQAANEAEEYLSSAQESLENAQSIVDDQMAGG